MLLRYNLLCVLTIVLVVSNVSLAVPLDSTSTSQTDTGGDPDSSVPDTATQPAQPQQPVDDEWMLGTIESTQRAISKSILGFSKSIDEYFSNERVMEEATGSYGCIRLGFLYQEHGQIDSANSVCLKVDLPNTRKRWKLFIERNDSDSKNNNLNSSLPATGDVNSNTGTGSEAGVSYVAKDELLKNFSFDMGIRSRLPLDPFARLRYRRTWVPSNWLYRLTENLYYYKSIEGGLLSRLDFERHLSPSWYTRITSQADYRDQDSEFYLKQIFGAYREVKKGQAMSFEYIVSGFTQPSARVDYYMYRFRYRFNVWRDWFFVETSPQLLHTSENNFRQVAGILISLEAVFGNF